MRRLEFDSYNGQHKVQLRALRAVYALFTAYIVVCILMVLVWGTWIDCPCALHLFLAFRRRAYSFLYLPLLSSEGLKFSRALFVEWLEGSALSVLIGLLATDPFEIYVKVLVILSSVRANPPHLSPQSC